MSGARPTGPVDARHYMSEYFRLERWEIPPPDGGREFSEFAGRMPLDDHHRGSGGGMRTGALLTNIDSVGGFLAGLSVLPRWIVTTSLMCTVTRLDHRGPLRVHGRVLRRGRNSVVAGLDVVDEGRAAVLVAASTATFSVLDPGEMNCGFERPAVGAHATAHRRCPASRGVLPDRARRRYRHPARAGRPPPQPLGDPPRRCGGRSGRRGRLPGCGRSDQAGGPPGAAPGSASAVAGVAAADTVLHFLRPVRIGPVEARCRVLGGPPGRTLVRVAIHDVGVGRPDGGPGLGGGAGRLSRLDPCPMARHRRARTREAGRPDPDTGLT